MNIRELFKKDKKTLINLATAFIIGLALIGGSLFFKPESEPEANAPPVKVETAEYEDKLERKLEEILSSVSGVGSVKVMLTLSQGREIVIVDDTSVDESATKETDTDGRSIEVHNKNIREQTVLVTDKNGVDQPIVIKEIRPQIEGVIIAAQGGDDPNVRSALTKATVAVLGVEPHKVEILKMR